MPSTYPYRKEVGGWSRPTEAPRLTDNGTEFLVEALDLVARSAVKPMIDVYPKERVAEAYEAAGTGKARCKAVVTF